MAAGTSKQVHRPSLEELKEQAGKAVLQGDLDKAADVYMMVEKICRESGNRELLAHALGDRAAIVEAWGNLDDAIDLYRESLGILRKLAPVAHLAGTMANLASALADKGLHREALPLAEEALEIAERQETDEIDRIKRILAQIRETSDRPESSGAPNDNDTPPTQDAPRWWSRGALFALDSVFTILGVVLGAFAARQIVSVSPELAGKGSRLFSLGTVTFLLCVLSGLLLGNSFAQFIRWYSAKRYNPGAQNPNRLMERLAIDRIDSTPLIQGLALSRLPLSGTRRTKDQNHHDSKPSVNEDLITRGERLIREAPKLLLEGQYLLGVLALIGRFAQANRFCPKCNLLVPRTESHCNCGQHSVIGDMEFGRLWYRKALGILSGRQTIWTAWAVIAGVACLVGFLLDLPALYLSVIPLVGKVVRESHLVTHRGLLNLVPSIQEVAIGGLTFVLSGRIGDSTWHAFAISVAIVRLVSLPLDIVRGRVVGVALQLEMARSLSEDDFGTVSK